MLALGRREVVASFDPAQLAPKSRERPAVAPGLARLPDDGAVLLGDCRLHRRGKLALVGDRPRGCGPDGRFAVGLDHPIGDPLELLAVAAVEREGDKAVEQLRDAQPLQLSPDREAWSRRLTGKPVGEQHPIAGSSHGRRYTEDA